MREEFMQGDEKLPDETRTPAQLLVELNELRRRVSLLDDLEERCLRAEAALQAVQDRSLLWREAAPMGLCTVDENGLATMINGKMRQMLSLDACESIGCLTPSEILESSIGEQVRRCLEHQESLVFELEDTNPHSPWDRLRFSLTPVCDTGGVKVGCMIFAEDITELNKAELAMGESERRFRQLFHAAPIPMMERDASRLKIYIDKLRASGITDFKEFLTANPGEVQYCMGMIKTLSCNGAFLDLLEVSAEEAMADGLAVARFENGEGLAMEILGILADGGLANEKERVFTTKKGNRKTVLVKTLVLTDPEDAYSRVIVAMVDISQRKLAEEALRASEQKFRTQALHDGLTGLYNRRYLYMSLETLIASAASGNSQVSVIFMDIDHFKQVVDTYGHLNGSQVIRELAATIGGALDKPAYAVAYAGDEFVVVLPGFNAGQAARKAQDIQLRIRQSVYLRDQGAEVHVRASFGIATFPDHAGDMRSLLGAADYALFTVKKIGRDSVKIYEPQQAEG